MASSSEGRYPEELRDMLCKFGLDWFADNPCVSAEKLENCIRYEFSEKQYRASLEDAKIKIENDVGRFTLDGNPRVMQEDPDYPELRCLILGKVGQGKSSLGNLLIGDDEFEVFDTVKSDTRGSHYSKSKEYNVQVIDTQGFADSEGEEVDLEMSKIFSIYHKGIHAFIFVIELSNPRITEEDIEVFKNLEKTFGKDILNYTFIVFTKAGEYFRKDENKTLKDYIKEMKETPFAEALEVIGNNVIAVENVCESYQRALTRQAVLSLISDSVRRSSNECYTNGVFQKAEEDMKKERERREALRREQKDRIEMAIKDLVKQELSMLECPNEVAERVDDTAKCEQVIGKLYKVIKGNKALKIEGLSLEAYKDYVTETAQRVLKDLAEEDLKNKFAELVKCNISDPNQDLEETFQEFKKIYQQAVRIVGELYIKSQIRQRISELKEIQWNKEAKEATEKRAQCEKMCSLILRHINFFDNPGRIEEMLQKEAEGFQEGDIKQLIEECLEENEVRKGIKREEERRLVILKEKEDDVKLHVTPLILGKLSKEKNINDIVKMVNKRSLVLRELCEEVKNRVEVDWMSTEEHTKFVETIVKRVLEDLTKENLKEKTVLVIETAVNDPKKCVDCYVQQFKRDFPDVAVRIKEPYIRSEVRRKLQVMLEKETKQSEEKKRQQQEKICAFICDHIVLFDKPERLQEMLAERYETFVALDLNQLTEECLENKEVRKKIKREEKRRRMIEKDLRNNIVEEARPFIKKKLSEANEMKDITNMMISGKKAILDQLYEELRTHEKIEWMTSDERREFVNKITGKTLFEVADEDLHYRMSQHIQNEVTDPKLSVDDHVKQLLIRHACAAMRVPEAYIRSEVRQRILDLNEHQQKEAKEQAVRHKALKGKICLFLMYHIELYDDPKQIRERLAEKGQDYCGEEIEQLIEDCLQNVDVRQKIASHQQHKRKIKVREIKQKVGDCAETHVAKFVCDLPPRKLMSCLKDKNQFPGYVKKIAKKVEREMGTEIQGYLTSVDVESIVNDVLSLTLENILEASFSKKVKMFFAPLLGLNFARRIMTPFVKKAACVLPLVL